MKEYEFKSIHQSLPDKDKILSNGHTYDDPDSGDKTIGFHVDDYEFLQQQANEKYGEFGGAISVHITQGENPIIFWVNMKLLKKFIFNGSMWIGPDGERAMLPKINSLGVMVSVLQSRETGFGIEISDAMMKLINERRAGKRYFDKLSAQYFHNTTEKAPLTESPVVRFFGFGGSNSY